MSFAKIAEARAVKKIVALIDKRAEVLDYANCAHEAAALRSIARDIEAGEWRDVERPKPKKKGKPRGKKKKD